MRRRPLRRLAAGIVLATSLTASAVAPALATEPGATTTTAAQPDVREELVGDSGSLHEVARALGLARPGAPTGRGVGIALVDTGVTDVPALRNSHVTIGPDFSLDAVVPDLVGRDANGHGTHMAGLIVGTDDAWTDGARDRVPGRQIGIAPDAHLVSVKVGAFNGAADVSQVIAAVNWVIEHRDEHDIRVLALAYGTDSTQDWQVDPLSHAVERAWHAGIVVVVAAGNAGPETRTLANPASNPWIVAVGAAEPHEDGDWLDDRTARAASFTQIGHRSRVDAFLPGRSVVGPRAVGALADEVNGEGRIGDDLVRATGTSQATAVAAGAVAAMLEARPDLTPDQVKRLLHLGGLPVEHDGDVVRRARFVRVDRALRRAERLGDRDLAQSWPRSDGSGSLDAARGTHRLEIDLDGDGVTEPITGEVDVFGQSFAADGWATDSFTGLSWNGLSWNGLSWNGFSWNGLSWNGFSWNGLSWNGFSWNGLSWNADDFHGLSWNGLSWNGSTWSGFSWNGLSWNGLSWNGSSWS